MSSNTAKNAEYVNVTNRNPKSLQLQKKRLLPAFRHAEAKRKISKIKDEKYSLYAYVDDKKVTITEHYVPVLYSSTEPFQLNECPSNFQIL